MIFRRLLPSAAIAAALSLAFAGCTVTGSDGQPVTLTAQNTAQTILPMIAKALVKGCAYYNANQTTTAVLTAAVEQAVQASANARKTTDTVENLTTLTCLLLAPSPSPPPATGG